MDAAVLIRQTRQRAGITQERLAARLGTTQPAIARWESGAVSPPRVAILERILAACGHDLDVHVVAIRPDPSDLNLMRERLRWSPEERLQYLVDMIGFEERARSADGRARHVWRCVDVPPWGVSDGGS